MSLGGCLFVVVVVNSSITSLHLLGVVVMVTMVVTVMVAMGLALLGKDGLAFS